MDLIELFKNLGSISDVPFEDTLLRKITMDYYYVLDIRKKKQEEIDNSEKDAYEAVFMKREGIADEIPKRIRLYAQPVKCSIGASMTTSLLSTESQIHTIIGQLEEIFHEPLLTKLNSSRIEFISENEDFEEHTGLKLRGYTTIAYEGRLLVDILKNYDNVIVEALYHDYLYTGDNPCYVCGNSHSTYFGALREPAWKLITTTRKSEISNQQSEVFVRCKECEVSIMRGVNLLLNFTRVTRGKSRNIERVIVPWTNDKRLWKQLIKIRKETDSDLRYYQVVERLYDRFIRRGLTQFIEIGVMRSNTSYGILSVDILQLSDLQGLKEKDNYERFLKNNNWLREDKVLPFYPEEVIQYSDEYRWRLMDFIKRYWIGKKDKKIWHHINGVVHLKGKDKVFYQLWEDYLNFGENELLRRILHSNGYITGKLVKLIGYLEQHYISNMDAENLLVNRFKVNNTANDYIKNECLKVYKRNRDTFMENNISLCKEIDTLLLSNTEDYLDDVNYFMLGRYEILQVEGKN